MYCVNDRILGSAKEIFLEEISKFRFSAPIVFVCKNNTTYAHTYIHTYIHMNMTYTYIHT
jgi:hypothetical protein